LFFGWTAEIVNVQGAFLCEKIEEGEDIYMKIPQGFEEYYNEDVLLFLLKMIYGLKQEVMVLWRKLISAFKDMNYKRSKTDPCLYFCWTIYGLIIWLSWIMD
jgi:hypothetical protein